QHVQHELRPGDRIVLRDELDGCHVCLRWQLIRFGERIDHTSSSLAPPDAARTWIIDPQGGELPMNAPEPSSRPPEGTPDRRMLDQRRFRAALGYPPSTYRFFCDVYLFAPISPQTAP